MRSEPKAEETAGVVSRETPRPSPWGTRVVSSMGSRGGCAEQARQLGAERTGDGDNDAPENHGPGTQETAGNDRCARGPGQPEPGERRPRPKRAKKTQERAHEKQKPGSQAQEESPRQGLAVQFQGSREVRYRPAGAYLPCAASPYLQCDARVQPVENDFSRSNVAFARDGFAERAQNGQRVGVRSPTGAPHDRGVGDVLAEKSSQVRAIVLEFAWTLD